MHADDFCGLSCVLCRHWLVKNAKNVSRAKVGVIRLTPFGSTDVPAAQWPVVAFALEYPITKIWFKIGPSPHFGGQFEFQIALSIFLDLHPVGFLGGLALLVFVCS